MLTGAKPVNAGDIARIVGDVETAIRNQDSALAFELANAAILGGARHPALLSARGIGLTQLGRHEEAIADFKSILAQFPRYPGIRLSIGQCYVRLAQWKDALDAFDTVAAMAPNFPLVHERRGLALGMLFQRDASRRAYESAVRLKPDFADALASLSMIAALEKDAAAAKSYADRALRADPGKTTALAALALLEIENGDVRAAEDGLAGILATFESDEDPRAISALGILADIFNELGRVSSAFSASTGINKKIHEIYTPRYEANRSADKVARLTAHFERSGRWAAGNAVSPEHDAASGHVFLVGFARSGTTLLEAVLASSDEVVALDERGCLRDAERVFLDCDASVDRLAALSESEIAHWRGVYWNAVRKQGVEVAGKLFLDKMPSYTIALPLIARLFPSAKVLFALRDPRDVVLSCFRHRFVMNSYTFEFLLLDNCARQYAAIMNLAECYRQKLPLNLHLHRYEDMVENFESSVQAACNFVGIEWKEALRDFGEGTRVVSWNGQSLRQLRKGLYSGAEGQWRRYRDQLAPVLPILAPWVERFGYAPE